MRPVLASTALVLLALGCAGAGSGGDQANFTGSASCGGCHATAYAAWRGSQHAVAMQPATDSTVLGDFADATLETEGTSSRFFRRGGKFLVNAPGANGSAQDFEVTHTFGVYPLQQYLVAFPGGRLQPLTQAWDARPASEGGQRWMALDVVAPLGPDDDMHWTGGGMNWNYMCADCHATAVRKAYDAAADSFRTRYSELGVGCEGCHGPGAVHVRWATTPGWRRGLTWRNNGLAARLDERHGVTWSIDSATGNARRSSPRTSGRELDVCAQCHARRVHIADGYTAGARFLDYYDLSPLVRGLYHPDGQQHDEVYNHGSFLQSRMHAAGVTCADCHDPHTQKLRLPGSAVCSQCHRPATYDTVAHHGHARGSAGSACASCHMPVATYLEIDGRHDHSLRVPRPDLAASLGVPDACAACHAGRGTTWAMDAIRSWRGRAPVGYQQFAVAFAADDSGSAAAAAPLVALVADTAQPPIVRAGALARLATHPGTSTRDAAARGARDASPLVRRAALDAIEAEPPAARLPIATPLLSDSIRAVRQQAAWVLAPVADSLATPEQRAAWDRASRDFMASQRYNADRAEHRVTLGAFLFARHDTTAAEAEFRAAVQAWPRHVQAAVNLAGILSLRGREADAEGVIREALRRVAESAELHFALGASLERQGRRPEAIAAIARAAALAPGNARYVAALATLRRVPAR